MARNGYKVTIYLDDNPNSVTYMETYEERVEDTDKCPLTDDDLVLISSECEIGLSGGYTGYRLLQYYNRTTRQYLDIKEQDAECEETPTEEEWVNSGSPFCETTEQGLNTGYMLQLQVQMNKVLPNYGETRYQKYKSPECGGNSCTIWELVSKQCHISVIDCVATFDGTADITEIDVNPLSLTYNQTRTVNKVDSGCENCTNSSFNWVLVGDMCGDDVLLCENGIQETSTNSYTVHRRYKTIGSAEPVPMDEYQVVLKTEDDVDCGYIRPQYEMRRMSGEYICDFETYTKYEKWCQYVSYDSGETWSLSVPEVCESGDVIAYDSYDCGKPMYRWIPNGEFTCVDNGDDGKIIYWDNDGVMARSYPCNESGVLTKAEYNGMTTVTSGITSPDGYKDTYQVGDCVSILADQALTGVNKKLWLGNYTERLGNRTLCGYSRALDIPSRVNDMSHRSFGTSIWRVGSRCWDVECQNSPNVMVMHPTTPPLLEHNDDLPWSMVLAPDSESSSAANAYHGSAIFVPNEAYEEYCNANVWSTHADSLRGRLLPMNNEPLTYKAVMDYESDFSKWKYFMVEGSDRTSIDRTDVYGLSCVKKVKISNQVKTIKSQAFSGYTATEIDFGNGVETIESEAFRGYSNVIGTNLTNLHFPSSLRSIGDNAFLYCENLSSITFDEGVETIGQRAFYQHNLSGTVEIPDSVKTIGSEAFAATNYGNSRPTNIKHIIIGSGCTEIYDGAFYQNWTNYECPCPLESVTIKALTPPTIVGSGTDNCGKYNGVFSYMNDIRMPNAYYCNFACGTYTIYVPCEAYEDYIDSPDWNFFARTAPEGYLNNRVSIEPYGCSGVEETIAVLHQTNGTDINITKPTEYRRKVLRESDISPYSATTSAITVNANCTDMENDWSFEAVKEIRFLSSNPPRFETIYYMPSDVIYVPCDGYDDYIDVFAYDNIKARIYPVITSECTNLEYRLTSTMCDTYIGKKVQRYTLYKDGEPEVYDNKTKIKDVETNIECFSFSASSDIEYSTAYDNVDLTHYYIEDFNGNLYFYFNNVNEIDFEFYMGGSRGSLACNYVLNGEHQCDLYKDNTYNFTISPINQTQELQFFRLYVSSSTSIASIIFPRYIETN
jgi:hypothetical protein